MLFKTHSIFVVVSGVLALMTSRALGAEHKSNVAKRHRDLHHFHHSNATARSAPELVVRHEGGLTKRFDNAKFSFFYPGASACGGWNVDSDAIVALNIPQFDGEPSHYCFQGITISYGGKTAQATIVDRCGDCPYGGLDLSPSLFDYFSSESIGIIYGTWNFGSGDPPPAPTTSQAPPPPPSPTSTYQSPTSTSSSASTSPSATQSAGAASAATVVIPDGAIAQFNLAFLELGGLIDAGASTSSG